MAISGVTTLAVWNGDFKTRLRDFSADHSARAQEVLRTMPEAPQTLMQTKNLDRCEIHHKS
jgi:uncharacterized membrane protein